MDANIISSFGVVAVAAYLVWKEYRTGTSVINSQVVNNYEALNKQQKEKIAEQEKAIEKYQADMAEIKTSMQKMKEEHARDIGSLQGQITAKDKHISDLQKTILNRNPELEKLLGDIRDFMENIYKQNQHQTTILEAGQLRNIKIDHATQQEEGHVLRKV